MKSALKIVAFHSGCEVSGITALAEVLIEALEECGHGPSALYVQMAHETYMLRAAVNADRELLGLSEMG